MLSGYFGSMCAVDLTLNIPQRWLQIQLFDWWLVGSFIDSAVLYYDCTNNQSEKMSMIGKALPLPRSVGARLRERRRVVCPCIPMYFHCFL